jgi:hypothetical protein
MNGNHYDNFDQVVDHVHDYIERNETYARERSESFSVRWHIWLTNVIRKALITIQGYVDENLIEPVKQGLIRRGFR